MTGRPPPATLPVSGSISHRASMIQQHATDTGAIDELLIALADSQRRAIVRHFHDSARDRASLAELSDTIRPPSNALTDAVAVQLHHSTLPRLEAAGLLEYDARTNMIVYRGHDRMESLLDVIDEL